MELRWWLNINFESVVSRQLIGMISKRCRHNTNALQGQSTHHIEEAEPALWSEARRNCVASACDFLEEADELGHALETWSDATTQYWVKVGRISKIPLSGKFAIFRMKPVLGETFMPLGCVSLEGGGMPN